MKISNVNAFQLFLILEAMTYVTSVESAFTLRQFFYV